MEFKKEFPSLHLKTWITGMETDVKSGTICGQRSWDDSGRYIKKKDVQEHCLDKQLVKKKLELLQAGQIEIDDIFKELDLK